MKRVYHSLSQMPHTPELERLYRAAIRSVRTYRALVWKTVATALFFIAVLSLAVSWATGRGVTLAPILFLGCTLLLVLWAMLVTCVVHRAKLQMWSAEEVLLSSESKHVAEANNLPYIPVRVTRGDTHSPSLVMNEGEDVIIIHTKMRLRFSHDEGRALVAHELAHRIISPRFITRLVQPLLALWNGPLAMSAHCITYCSYFMGWHAAGGGKMLFMFQPMLRVLGTAFDWLSEHSGYAVDRAEEYAADMVGSLLMRDTRPMVLMLAKMQEMKHDDRVPTNLGWRVTHPLFSERIRALEAVQRA